MVSENISPIMEDITIYFRQRAHRIISYQISTAPLTESTTNTAYKGAASPRPGASFAGPPPPGGREEIHFFILF